MAELQMPAPRQPSGVPVPVSQLWKHAVSVMLQKLSSLQHQMRMLDGRMWKLGPDKPYHNMTDLWDGEVPEANLE